MGNINIGVNNVARKIKNAYIGVNGIARQIQKAYIGVNGIAREIYSAYNFPVATVTRTLTQDSISYYEKIFTTAQIADILTHNPSKVKYSIDMSIVNNQTYYDTSVYAYIYDMQYYEGYSPQPSGTIYECSGTANMGGNTYHNVFTGETQLTSDIISKLTQYE